MSGASNRNTTRVVVIMLTWNQRETTLRCLASLRTLRELPFQTVLWDNGSVDGTACAVREVFPEVLVHQHPTNLGVASGRNEAARLAIETFAATHLLFLDNDMLPESGFVAALLELFMADARVGQTQAKLRFAHDRSRLNDGGGARVNFVLGRIGPVGFGELDRGQYDEPRKCLACGGAMMVRADLFQQLGGFDKTFDPFGPEDLDFTLRLRKSGYEALYVPKAVAYHTPSHSYGRGYTEDYARCKSRFWLILLRRHASPWEQAGFFMLGAPLAAARALWREVRRGNISGVRGLLRGTFDFVSGAGGGHR